MGKIKVTRKSLKRDEVKDFWLSCYEYCRKNLVTISTTAGIVLFVIVVSQVWGMYRQKRLSESGRMLSNAMAYYQQGLLTDEGRERDTFLLQAIDICEQLRNQYPGSSAGRQSLLVKANAQFALDSASAAILQYTEFRDTANDPQERALAEVALGYCYENEFFRGQMRDARKAQDALAAYERAIKIVGDAYPAREALMGQARICEVIGKFDPRGLDQAIEKYERVIKITDQMKARNKERFGAEEEPKKKSERKMLPSIPEVFDASAVAQTQIDRLKVLIASGEAAAAAERSIPPASSPADTQAATRAATAPAASARVPATSARVPAASVPAAASAPAASVAAGRR